VSVLNVLAGFILFVVAIVIAAIALDQLYWYKRKRHLEQTTNVMFPMTNVNVVTNPTTPSKTSNQQDANEPPNSTP
jgi:hypothetical protein